MNIDEQVVSLELSRRIHDIGFNKHSYFTHELKNDGSHEIYHSKATSIANKYYSAFTVCELHDIILPYCKEIETELLDDIDGGYYRVCSYLLEGIFDARKEADALARILIVLLEKNIIKI